MWIWKRLLHSHWRDEVLCHYKSFSWNPLCFSTRPVRKFFSWLNFGFEQLAHKPNFKRCLEGISPSKQFGILTSRYLPRKIGSAVSILFAVNVLIFFKDLGFRIFCTARLCGRLSLGSLGNFAVTLLQKRSWGKKALKHSWKYWLELQTQKKIETFYVAKKVFQEKWNNESRVEGGKKRSFGKLFCRVINFLCQMSWRMFKMCCEFSAIHW